MWLQSVQSEPFPGMLLLFHLYWRFCHFPLGYGTGRTGFVSANKWPLSQYMQLKGMNMSWDKQKWVGKCLDGVESGVHSLKPSSLWVYPKLFPSQLYEPVNLCFLCLFYSAVFLWLATKRWINICPWICRWGKAAPLGSHSFIFFSHHSPIVICLSRRTGIISILVIAGSTVPSTGPGTEQMFIHSPWKIQSPLSLLYLFLGFKALNFEE